jgi:hypothetical protein
MALRGKRTKEVAQFDRDITLGPNAVFRGQAQVPDGVVAPSVGPTSSQQHSTHRPCNRIMRVSCD